MKSPLSWPGARSIPCRWWRGENLSVLSAKSISSGLWARRVEGASLQIISHSPHQTLALGRALARNLQPGDILLLHGDLGAGKTELVRGLAAGLGLAPDQVSSPTFALVHQYPARIPLVHVDLYRLMALEDEFILELEDYWQQPVVTVIEWAERLGLDLPDDYLNISLSWLDEHTRLLEIAGTGPRGRALAGLCRDLGPGRKF